MTDQEIKNQINSAKEELRKEIQELKRPRKPEPILKHNPSGGDSVKVNMRHLAGMQWDDIRVNPGSFNRPGSSDPTIVAYQPAGSGTTSYLYQFAKNNIASFTIQIPHGYKEGEDIFVHVHWTPGANGVTENGNMVGWKVDYSWANFGSTFPAMTTADLSDVCDGTNHKHQMTAGVRITGSGKQISSMLICNITRTDTGADDTWSGTLSGALPMLLEVDFHYPINSIGSNEIEVKN